MSNPNMGRIQVNVFGGIGNQFFCYFAGKYLSEELGLGLTVNVSTVKQSQHKFGSRIDDFDLQEEIVSSREQFSLNTTQRIVKKIAVLSNGLLGRPSTFKSEFLSRGLGFEPNLERIRKPIILNSYFQSYRYYDSLPNDIQAMPILKGIRSNSFNRLLNIAQDQRPIMIHFRRGDYLNLKNSFGILNQNYYRNAFSQLPKDLIKNRCWVFSDDLNAAKSSLGGLLPSNTRWVDSKQEFSSAETLQLMSLGSAYIIANSTFSYWGAKFNKNNPFVIAPNKWFKNLKDPADLIPPNWHLAESFWE